MEIMSKNNSASSRESPSGCLQGCQRLALVLGLFFVVFGVPSYMGIRQQEEREQANAHLLWAKEKMEEVTRRHAELQKAARAESEELMAENRRRARNWLVEEALRELRETSEKDAKQWSLRSFNGVVSKDGLEEITQSANKKIAELGLARPLELPILLLLVKAGLKGLKAYVRDKVPGGPLGAAQMAIAEKFLVFGRTVMGERPEGEIHHILGKVAESIAEYAEQSNRK